MARRFASQLTFNVAWFEVSENLSESYLSEESLWASGVAARLRLVQANFADDDAAMRKGYLAQELEQSLKGLTQEKRKVLLEALTERFPAGEGGSTPAPVAIATAPGTPETPESLLDRLLNALPELPAEQRSNFTQRLREAGLVVKEPGQGFEAPPELLKRLNLSPDQSLNPERAAKTLLMLFEIVLTLDQLSWTLWKQVAPRSAVRKEVELGKLAAEYISGNPEVSGAQVLQALERTRKLTAGLLGALGRAGASYARDRARLFDPNAIEADARAEKKWNESMEFACWRKYVQLCKEYGAEAAIEKNIQEAMAKAAENLILGRPS